MRQVDEAFKCAASRDVIALFFWSSDTENPKVRDGRKRFPSPLRDDSRSLQPHVGV